MPSWTRSLQFKLTLGFTLIMTGALLSVSAFTYAATQRTIDTFGDEISVARAERLDQVVSDSYNKNESWDGVQDALVQASRLYDWRIIIEDERGLIVGDSHMAFNRDPLVSSFFFRRPVVVGGVQMGNFFIEAGNGFVAPPGDRSSFIKELERQKQLPEPSLNSEDKRADITSTNPTTEPQLSELLSSFNRSLLWSGLVSAFAGIGLVAFTTRRALNPVHQLSVAAAGVAHGNLSQRVQANPGSELGDLGVALNNMADSLEDAENERRRMVADIAHELRSPLTNIQGYLEAIKDGMLAPDETTLDTIYAQTRHLGALVEDLRLLALVEAGSLRLELVESQLYDLVNDASKGFQPRALDRSITLHVSANEEIPKVFLDPTRIRQVISNLVENAITHTPNGGRVDVIVKLNADGDAAVIRISDSGIGIPAEDLPHIFDRFYRVDPSRQRSTGGAGLGLTIVKRLVEIHGGQIKVNSDQGSGTTFTICIPLSRPPTCE